MKKEYITPACTTISVRTAHLLTISQNEYSNDQGHIHFKADVVEAEDAD
jgi:hypothetical protein